MRATWRPLPAWPYMPQASQVDRFQSGWNETLAKLEREVEALSGSDLVIGVVAADSEFSISGQLKARAKLGHAGAEVSFDVPKRGRLVFHTAAFPSLQSNLRGIALGLEALRAVDRYGITTTAEQYAGFAALTPGGPDPARGQELVERAGGITPALKRHHPDHGGDARDFADVQAYRERVGDR